MKKRSLTYGGAGHVTGGGLENSSKISSQSNSSFLKKPKILTVVDMLEVQGIQLVGCNIKI